METKKQIVFIEGYTTVMVYKIAKILKQKGYETVLIRLLKANPDKNDFYQEGYDHIIDLNISYLKLTNSNLLKIFLNGIRQLKSMSPSLKKIFRLRPYIIIGRTPTSTAIALFRVLFWKYPFVYFPYDIRSQSFPTLKIAKKELPFFEIFADRFCFEHSDGVMHKGAPNELDYLNGRMLGDNIKLPKHILCFQPYCSQEFIVPLNKNKLSKRDNELHFVYVGGTGYKTKEYYLEQMNNFQKVLENKIHVHLYFSSDLLDDEEKVRKEFFDYYKSLSYIKYFHIHPPFNARDIVKEISKYDYGTTFYDLKRPEYDIEHLFGTGNKISTYLEAGIPFFYRSDVKYVNTLRKKYGINVNWPEDMDNLKKIVKNWDYKKLESGTIKMRKDFLIEKHITRFEEFIDNIVRDKKNHAISISR